MAGRYVLKSRRDGQFYFNLESGNYKTILTSEGYKSKAGANNGIQSCKQNSPIDARYERLSASNGEPYFVLKAANGEPIGRSETYSSSEARERGIEAVKREGPRAEIVDRT